MASLHSCILLLLLFECAIAQYTVEVWEPFDPYNKDRSPFAYCYATGANFGQNITSTWRDPKAAGCALKVTPEDACSPVILTPINGSSCHFHYAVVPIGKCSYSEKAYYVQNTSSARGFDGLIIYNAEGKERVDMDGGKYAEAVKIPVVMVDYVCMKIIIERYPAYKGYTVQIYHTRSILDIIFGLMLIIGLAGLLLAICCCYKSIVSCMRSIRDRAREEWESRGRTRKYKKLPTKKFAIGDQPDTCVICIVEFVTGEKLTELPCKHMYHHKCIVTWLVEHEKCPMCRDEVDVETESTVNDDGNGSPQAIEEQEPSSSRAQVHRIPGRNDPPSSQGPSEAEAGSSREIVGVEAGSNENVMHGQVAQNGAEPLINSVDESNYSLNENDETRLVEAEGEARAPPSSSQGTVANALQTLRSLVGRSTTPSRSLQTGGVENAAFDEERGSTTVDDEQSNRPKTTLNATLFLLLFGCTTAIYRIEMIAPESHYSQERKPVATCVAKGANFGPNITIRWGNVTTAGCALKVTPKDACSPVTKRMGMKKYSRCHGKFYAVVPAGNCSFSEKAYYVQGTASSRGFDGLIVYNEKGKHPEEMVAGKFANKVKIPAVMVDYDCMEELIERFPERQGYTVLIYQPLSPLETVLTLLVIIGIIAFCLLMKYILTAFVKCCGYVRQRSHDKWTRWVQMRKYRRLPTKKYAIGDQPDTCVICFEEFARGEKLTELPCEHMYHYKCIVPWLAENGKCPMCQRPVWDAGVETTASGNNGDRQGARRGVTAAASPPLNPRAVVEHEASSPRAQISRLSAPTSSSETEDNSLRERQVNLDGTSGNVMMAADEDRSQMDNGSEESYYSTVDDETRLLEAEEGPNEGASTSTDRGAVAGAARSLRSFARGRSTTSRRSLSDGIDNAAFEEEGSSMTVDDETIQI